MNRYEYLGEVKYHLQRLQFNQTDKVIDTLLDRFIEKDNDAALINELGPAENIANKYVHNKADVTVDEEISAFSFETQFVPVEIHESEDDLLHFNVSKDIDMDYFKYEIADGKLEFKLMLPSSNKETKLEIFLPNKEIESLEISQHYSSVNAKSLKAKHIRLKNDVGQVLIETLEADELTCFLKTGEMRIDDLETNHLNFNVSTGKLVLDNVNSDQHIDGKVATGNAMITLDKMFNDAELTLKEQFGALIIDGYDEEIDGTVLGDGKYKVKLVASYGTLIVDTN